MKHKLHVLEKSVTNTMALLSLDGNHETIESSMCEVQQRLQSQEARICDLVKLKDQLTETEASLRSKLSVMTQDNISLRELTSSLQDNLDHLQQTSSADVGTLKTRLKEEQDKASKMKKLAESTEAMYRNNIHMLEQEVSKINEQLLKTAKELDSTGKERDNARGQLAAVNERTRKLLFSLDLTREVGDSLLSLDHARNMVYVKRRKGSLAPLGRATHTVVGPNEGDIDKHEAETPAGSASEFTPAKESSRTTQPKRGSITASRSKPHGIGNTPRRESITIMSYGGQKQKPRQQQQKQPLSPKSTSSEANEVTRNSDTNGSTTTSEGEPPTKEPLTGDQEDLNSTASSPRDASAKKSLVNGNQSTCAVCSKQYHEVSNFEGACLFHPEGAIRLNVGTELEVWSCCRSRDTYKGCRKARHMTARA